MKTAISVPDQIFEEAEELARQTKKSRSQIYAEALREYLARHAPDAVTEAMDRVVAEVGAQADEFVSASTLRVLERSEW